MNVSNLTPLAALLMNQGIAAVGQSLPGIRMQAAEGGVPAGDNLSIRGFNV